MSYAILIMLCGLSLTACDDGGSHREVIPLNLFDIPTLVGALLVATAVLSVARKVTRAQEVSQ